MAKRTENAGRKIRKKCVRRWAFRHMAQLGVPFRDDRMFKVERSLQFEGLESRNLLSADVFETALSECQLADCSQEDRAKEIGQIASNLNGSTDQSANLSSMLSDLQFDTTTFEPGSVLVRMRPGVAGRELLAQTLPGGEIKDESELVPGLFEVQLPHSVNVETAVRSLNAQDSVLYAHPDYYVKADDAFIPDDTDFEELWGLHNTGQSGGTEDADIDAPEAWDVTTGDASVVVAVIDTGVDYTHADLVDNIWTNPGEIAGDGLDNDGNGYIDDVQGWDFCSDGDNDPMDEHSHGTHVAGTIAAMGNNTEGVAGIAWDVQIMPLKFMDASKTGSTSDAIEALEYAVAMGAMVSNNSYGTQSFAFSDAIAAAGDAGHVFVASAGNDGTDTDASPHFPSGYSLDNIISVAATDDNDNKAGFSNYGETSVDLGAPGVGIYSTWLGGGYGNKSGTSMAAPHVTGTVALLQSLRPDWSIAEVKDAILNNVDPIAALNGKCVSGGRLNAHQAVAATYLAGPEVHVHLGTASLLDETGTVDFGTTLEGTAVSKTFRVRNLGQDPAADPLTLSDLTVPDGFTVMSGFGDTSLAAGESTTFSVELAGATAGDYSGDVSFTTNDSDEALYNFQINGSVEAPPTVQVIDDADAGFSTIGAWSETSSVGGFNGSVTWSWGSTLATKTATWEFLVGPGQYEVAATWPADTLWATNAEYTIQDGGIVRSTQQMNQELTPADFTDQGVGWSVVDTVEVTGDWLYVSLSNLADDRVCADAIRVAEVGASSPGITVTPTAELTTTEAGGTAEFTVVLDSQPAAEVVLPIHSSDTSEGTISPSSLTFTPENWNDPRTVTATGVDDLVDDGDIAWTAVVEAAISDDSRYDGLDAMDVALTNQDDDTAGITIAPTSGLLATEAGATDTLTLVLDSQPTADVTIELSTDDQVQISLDNGTTFADTGSLTFSPDSAMTPQSVMIKAVDDGLLEGNHSGTVTLAAQSADAQYDQAEIPDNTVTIVDNETLSVENAVVINGGGQTRSMLTELTVSFNADVEIAADAFQVVNRDTSEEVLTEFSEQVVDGKSVVTITFLEGPSVLVRPSGNTLEDANYELKIDASKVTYNGMQLDGDGDGSAGGDYVFGDEAVDDFFRFYGDKDGDRDVDLSDFAYFRMTFEKNAGDSFFDGEFDYEGDGDVDLSDFMYFRMRFGKTLSF